MARRQLEGTQTLRPGLPGHPGSARCPQRDVQTVPVARVGGWEGRGQGLLSVPGGCPLPCLSDPRAPTPHLCPLPHGMTLSLTRPCPRPPH